VGTPNDRRQAGPLNARLDGDDLASKNDGDKAPLVTDRRSVNGLQPAAANQVYEDARAIAHTAIADLVNASKATTRLVNAVNRAHHRRTLPFRTNREYVAAGESAKDAMLSVQGVGRKVANELDALVRSALANPTTVDRAEVDATSTAAKQTWVPTAQFCEKRLAELLEKVPFPSVLYGFPPPGRLEKSLKQLQAAKRLPVRTLFTGRRKCALLLLQQRNCGRKALVALENVCASIFYAMLVHCGMKQETAQSAARRLLLMDRDAFPACPACPGAEVVRMLSGSDSEPIDLVHIG
jgi:hypothetical protein